MTVHYLLNCYNNQILVKQVDGEADAFHVNIQSNSNPLSFGNTLYTASNKDQAVRIANQLCAFYSMARANGYHLEGSTFRNGSKSDITVEHVLKVERTKDEMHNLLQRA
ncbi:hypothetical protein [Paenibacillus sacheonensis]|uniref:Uncharacterized protein n=1 Tax=Paenibacillus sacheonensis TaxID=742054 RepID=A0A7X5BX36_9BACL|nr:hypothetical protein [Paenibacillus sacheonensis]MBM7563265.1 hypothetical protein [Paenibacillus sacheonensis]NBC68177.1 hypothetical protein [Paenibacillus sacheonensis]